MRPDVERIVRDHRRALVDQALVYWGVALVLGCTAIGLVVGIGVWGWPQ
jgi:hypothetical protein